jgi:hypothetical protein
MLINAKYIELGFQVFPKFGRHYYDPSCKTRTQNGDDEKMRAIDCSRLMIRTLGSIENDDSI